MTLNLTLPFTRSKPNRDTRPRRLRMTGQHRILNTHCRIMLAGNLHHNRQAQA